jgi:hypothetical protein
MNNANRSDRLTAQDWFWIVFVAVIASIATFGSFIIFLPAYIASVFVGYMVAKRSPSVFDRTMRTIFVLKVLAVVLPTFALFFFVELWLMSLIYA